MTDTVPTPWLALFDEYHRIVRSTWQILRDADRLMASRGYGSLHAQNVVGTEGSLHMELSEKWVHGWFVRFYKNEARPPIYPYVAVFLHDRGGAEDYIGRGRLREPLVVAGVIRSATEAACKWQYWHAKQWFWSGGEVDGAAVIAKHDADNKDGQATNEAFAIRLERLTGLTDIEQLVVEPLVKLIH